MSQFIVPHQFLIDMLNLLANEVTTDEQRRELHATLFETDMGDQALEAFEKATGLTLAPVELFERVLELGPLTIEVGHVVAPSAGPKGEICTTNQS